MSKSEPGLVGRVLRGPLPFAAFFAGAGVLHFRFPETYMRIMPKYMPLHRELVLVSGGVEIASGLGLIPKKTRKRSAQLVVATLIAVFPSNIEMTLHPENFPEIPAARASLIARLPLQILMIRWVLRAAKNPIA